MGKSESYYTKKIPPFCIFFKRAYTIVLRQTNAFKFFYLIVTFWRRNLSLFDRWNDNNNNNNNVNSNKHISYFLVIERNCHHASVVDRFAFLFNPANLLIFGAFTSIDWGLRSLNRRKASKPARFAAISWSCSSGVSWWQWPLELKFNYCYNAVRPSFANLKYYIPTLISNMNLQIN